MFKSFGKSDSKPNDAVKANGAVSSHEAANRVTSTALRSLNAADKDLTDRLRRFRRPPKRGLRKWSLGQLFMLAVSMTTR